MQHARFNAERERAAKIFCKSYKNDRCIFQFHSQIEIYFINEGEMEMRVDGRTELLRAPAVSVALSYSTHAYRTPTSSASSVLLIPPHVCEEFIEAVKGKSLASPFITDPEVCAELRSCYERIVAAEDKPILRLGYIYTALGILLDALALVDKGGDADSDLTSRILLYIDENYKNGITPKDVSRHFGYSNSYVSRYFSSALGTTLSKYITSVKLRSAVMLMREGRHDVTYCAFESGFSSMRTFYRAFREEFGSSPKDFIKAQKE
ncbi:MAG: helix-turn-helix domain-containing protein [Clostridia bacterium]|nr:helix-turn-helix domain-containing protein [Clostridia bacterium]